MIKFVKIFAITQFIIVSLIVLACAIEPKLNVPVVILGGATFASLLIMCLLSMLAVIAEHTKYMSGDL